jgi:hypothetical protein
MESKLGNWQGNGSEPTIVGGIVRLASGAFYAAIPLATFYEIIIG